MTDDLDRTRLAYDTVAEDYHRLVAPLLDADVLGRAMLGGYAETAGAGPVLDAGCGTGLITAYLADRGVPITGIDLSPGMIEVARRANPGLEFQVGSMTALPFPDDALAGVVSWWSIVHTPQEQLPAVLAEFARVLAPGGQLLLGFHVGDGSRHLARAYGHDTDYEVHLVQPQHVSRLLVALGFRITARLEMAGAHRPGCVLQATRDQGLDATRTADTAVHHVELWVPDVDSARACWGWLLTELGWTEFQDWPAGCSWRAADGSYLVVERSPVMTGDRHDRNRPGLNHLALTAPRAVVDRIAAGATGYGWTSLFPDRYPHAGGPDHYAAYLENGEGFEVEVVATDVLR